MLAILMFQRLKKKKKMKEKAFQELLRMIAPSLLTLIGFTNTNPFKCIKYPFSWSGYVLPLLNSIWFPQNCYLTRLVLFTASLSWKHIFYQRKGSSKTTFYFFKNSQIISASIIRGKNFWSSRIWKKSHEFLKSVIFLSICTSKWKIYWVNMIFHPVL